MKLFPCKRGREGFWQGSDRHISKEHGFSFYVTFEVDIPKPKRSHKYAWKEYEGSFDEIKKMHFKDLMTVGQ
ncbi:hypothetical protein TH62_20970 [Bacillus sp. TH008]|nr:hypothetical protein TH62_20970 [Bacillus sp. TH008]